MADQPEDKKKILVVDDYAENVELLADLLTLNGYVVSTAYDGEEALQKVRHDLPDLILLDVMMPEMDGYQVCEALRRVHETQELPIIFVTAKSEVKDWNHAIFTMGANSYITKPINAKKLLEKVKSVLHMKHSRDGELRTPEKHLSETLGRS